MAKIKIKFFMEYFAKSDGSIFDKIESIQEAPLKFVVSSDFQNIKINHEDIINDDFGFFLSPLKGTVSKKRILLTRHNLIIFSIKDNERPKVIFKIRNPRISHVKKLPCVNVELCSGILIQGYMGCISIYFASEEKHQSWIKAFAQIGIQSNILNYYEQGNLIGKGHFAKVILGTHKLTKKEYAIKSISKEKLLMSKVALHCFYREIEILKELNHQNVIKLYEIFEGEKNVYLVLEYLKGGELFRFIKARKKYSEEIARVIIHSVLKTLEYIHSKNIIHRDIKPENIILIDHSDLYEIKIADFGLAIKLDELGLNELKCGSPGYIAPEILNGEKWGVKADIFSVGVILHMMLTGFPAFHGHTLNEIIEKNRECKINFQEPFWEKVSAFAKDLCTKLMEKNPSERISIEKALNHPWLSQELQELDSLDFVKDNLSHYKNEFTASKNKFEDKGSFRTSTPLFIENENKGFQLIQSPCFTPKLKKANRKGSTNISPLLKKTLKKEFEQNKLKSLYQFSPVEFQSQALKNSLKDKDPITKENLRPSYLSANCFDKENNDEEDNIPDEYDESEDPRPTKKMLVQPGFQVLENFKIQELLIPSMQIKTKQEMTSANAVFESPRRFSDPKKIYTSKLSNEILIKSKSKTNSASKYSPVYSFDHKTNIVSTFYAGEKKELEDSKGNNEEIKIAKVN